LSDPSYSDLLIFLPSHFLILYHHDPSSHLLIFLPSSFIASLSSNRYEPSRKRWIFDLELSALSAYFLSPSHLPILSASRPPSIFPLPYAPCSMPSCLRQPKAPLRALSFKPLASIMQLFSPPSASLFPRPAVRTAFSQS